MNDPACMQAVLFVSAVHRELLSGSKSLAPLESYLYKGEAIRLINERLGDPDSRLQEGTIAAIACLAAYEVSTQYCFSSSL